MKWIEVRGPPRGPGAPVEGDGDNPANLGQGITFDALKAQLTKHEGLLQNLSISIDRWLVPPKVSFVLSYEKHFVTIFIYIILCIKL